MSKKYKVPEEKQIAVSESVAAYQYSEQQQIAGVNVALGCSDLRRKGQLRANLHPSTVEYLDSVGWMEDRPFPAFVEPDDESWIDDAESNGLSDIVEDERIAKDKAAWLNVR